jgi:thiol:disulfide interchange protein DsbD
MVMGFLLLGTAVWLMFSFAKQVTPDSLVMFLFFLLALAVAFWAGHRFGGIDRTNARRWIVRGLAGAFVFGVFKLTVHLEPAALAKIEQPTTVPGEGVPPVVVDGHIAWVPYSAARLKSELEHNRPVFLDFTAEWCATCKANEAAFVETDVVRQAFARTKILPMKVDMTSADDDLEALQLAVLKGHEDREGIPIYVVKFPGGEQDLLPLVISSGLVEGRLDAAAKQFPPDRFLAMR